MGEIAEMMLDGTLCCQCGCYIGNDGGYPVKCSDCKPKKKRRKKTAVRDNKEINK